MHQRGGVDDARSRGWRYLVLSREYAAAARMLATSPKPDEIGRAFWAITSHALELSLKAFLRSQGSSEERLMMINHSLERSLSSCLAEGLIPRDRELAALIDVLDVYHAAQTFRYPGWGTDLHRLPLRSEAARILAAHLEQLEAILPRSS